MIDLMINHYYKLLSFWSWSVGVTFVDGFSKDVSSWIDESYYYYRNYFCGYYYTFSFNLPFNLDFDLAVFFDFVVFDVLYFF